MHQYAADLANRQVGAFDDEPAARAEVTAIVPRSAPVDRYAPRVKVRPAAAITGTGLQRSNLSWRGLRAVLRAIRDSRPDVVHFTGPHIWNPVLLWRLHRAHIPTIHTVHDLDPHSGTGYGRMLYAWNDAIFRQADHILVHGQIYRARLLVRGLPAQSVTYTPLLHLCVGYDTERALHGQPPIAATQPVALFFARLEAYKGVDVLVEAMRQLQAAGREPELRAIIAGSGDPAALGSGPLPANVEVRNRLIEDQEALELFSQCRVVVLPYRDATQTALIAAAYFFGKPVIVTRAGALPEYVLDNETGWIVPPGDATALAEALHAANRDAARLAEMGAAGRSWYHDKRAEERRTLRRMYETVSSQGRLQVVLTEQATRGGYSHD